VSAYIGRPAKDWRVEDLAMVRLETENRVARDFPSHGFAFRKLACAFAEAADGRGAMIATGADGRR
jgi:hypothetical protein